MAQRLNITFDSELIDSISADFDLREPNKQALRQLVFTLDGEYEPGVMQVLDLATGVGKTYLMAAFMEYLRRHGLGNVVIVTPGKVVQYKTVQNFSPGSPRYIPGAEVPPDVVTPQDYSKWVTRSNGPARLSFGREVPMLAFIFNIQQLIAPNTEEGDTLGDGVQAMRRRPRRFDENAGVLFDYLKNLDDLVVIADESHLYSSSAEAFHAALKELDPAACIGLTASASKSDNVIFRYPLYKAIEDKYVKAPVLAFRKEGYDESLESEEQQLRDALQLRQIKQACYDAYTEQHGLPRLTAVAFIVCSDVEHATQVADLLKTPEYLGREKHVLQVDSKHEDEMTQRRLENLDMPDSEVLAVVSVNKLKEGWDVKNISVIVTLRAMASEVLTQQTMGRGLRLPFGRYTGVFQIDQLDIISHQSFKELLHNENVLRQFGLENAVPRQHENSVNRAIKDVIDDAVTTDSDNITGSIVELESFDGANDPHGEGSMRIEPIEGQTKPGIGIRAITSTSGINEEIDFELITIEPNERFADVTYNFPVTRVELQQPPVNLAEIDDADIDHAARRVTSAGDMLYRKEIVAKLGKQLKAVDAEGAEVESAHISEEEAATALTKLIVDMAQVPKSPSSIATIKNYIVPRFMREAPIDTWTVKALDSACALLRELISSHIAETLRGTKEVPTVYPKKMQAKGFSLPLGEKVHDPIDSREEFVAHRVYGGWFKSLVEAESFDSYSGEYELARLLNTSPNIIWWQRLHPHDEAFIYFNPKDRYFPDFVAYDDEGVYWIIEGKSERGRDDAVVQEKRKAAETLVRSLTGTEGFIDQNWGYLIAYEDDIARSDSWSDLKALAQPVSNKID